MVQPDQRRSGLSGAGRRQVATAVVLGALLVVLSGFLYLRLTYQQPVAIILEMTARIVLDPLLAWNHADDAKQRDQLVATYDVGYKPGKLPAWRASWRLAQSTGAWVELVSTRGLWNSGSSPPFVYESANAPYLRELARQYDLTSIASLGTVTEYESMLRVGAWAGTRWDHGTDPLVGSRFACDPVGLIRAGEAGEKYWCEIASRVMVNVATAIGWPARVVTGSRDGYTWEHAVAELWSNDFQKWFVMDTDFNVVYESGGVPLSAFELAHDGPHLRDSGKLVTRRFAPAKPSLPLIDVIPFYRWVHIDMRNDWCTRPLRPGSPAGGDLATWWTARDDLGPVLTAKVRVDDPNRFNWPVNVVSIYLISARRLGSRSVELSLGLRAYSPAFAEFELSMDGGPWATARPQLSIEATPGRHVIKARVRTRAGSVGPVAEAIFDVAT